jgi:predicted acetyltransferase
MAVDLSEARLGDRDTIADLLDDYLQELAQHREVAVGATDSRSYPYLDGYFSEPGRRAFLIRREGKLAGFALIREPASTGRFWEVAEFFITPASRRMGVGRDALALIWRRFPGSWELQVHARNTAALRFWTSCIEASAQEDPELTEVETVDGKRFQFDFRVELADQGAAVAPGRTECIMNVELAESDADILACFPVMLHLRDLRDASSFLRRVRDQERSGYRLAGLRDGGEPLAVAGFRFGENLAWGKHLYVDDLVTLPDARSRGYGTALLAWLSEFAESEGARQLHLDSGTGRVDAHRFYQREGLLISGFHFQRVLSVDPTRR